MKTGIIEFSIKNFRGIVALSAKPNGKSVTLKGKNGAGKSSAIDALWWALGGQLDGEVVRNGAEGARVELLFGEYRVTRAQSKGKRPTITVGSGDGKAKFTSPTALLAGFVGAVERRTFSAKTAKERAEVLRRLAPGLDCGDLDAERARVYEERTGINRDGKLLRAQAEGVVAGPDVAFPGEERDLAAIASRKAEVAQVKAANERRRAELAQVRHEATHRLDVIRAKRRGIEELQRELADLEAADRAADEARATLIEQVAALVDPDASAIDAEIAAAKQHNAGVRAAQAQQAAVLRARADRARIEQQAAAKESDAAKLTARIDAIDAEKTARLAAAALPIPGIGLAGDVVTFNDGTSGPVELEALNTAARIRLDVAIAAALGHHLIAVRDASLLDAEQRAEIDRFAAERGVQLLAEVVASGEPLTAEIIEGEPLDAVVAQENFEL